MNKNPNELPEASERFNVEKRDGNMYSDVSVYDKQLKLVTAAKEQLELWKDDFEKKKGSREFFSWVKSIVVGAFVFIATQIKQHDEKIAKNTLSQQETIQYKAKVDALEKDAAVMKQVIYQQQRDFEKFATEVSVVRQNQKEQLDRLENYFYQKK